MARWIASEGHDAVHVLDRGYETKCDHQLWQLASDEGRIVVSKDEDFFFLATRPNDIGRLLWIRIGNCRKHQLIAALESNWALIVDAFQRDQQVVELR